MYMPIALPTEGGALQCNRHCVARIAVVLAKLTPQSVQRRAHRIVYARTVLTPAHIYGLVLFSTHGSNKRNHVCVGVCIYSCTFFSAHGVVI
jgi:hypothetical protein